MWTSSFNPLRNAFVTVALVLCCLLPQEAIAVAIYDWTPDPGPQSGGSGFISLIPLGAGATDTDFTSSTVTDFTFTFDNGAPITLSDLIIGNSPIAVTGVLVAGWSFRENPTTFTDAELTFAAASADYTNSILFPFESNGGSWFLRGGPDPSPIPEPSTMLLLGSGLAGLGYFRQRRKAA